MVLCIECATSWPAESTTPKCAAPEHAHREHELHRHRTAVALPDGTKMVAVSFDEASPDVRDRVPDFGLYLDRRWQPPWPHEHVDWPDFGVPADLVALRAALDRLLHRARSGERVEIGRLGGHGRTGTALACLTTMIGHPVDESVAWVRANYCDKAVETDDQAAFVSAFPPVGRGRAGGHRVEDDADALAGYGPAAAKVLLCRQPRARWPRQPRGRRLPRA